MQRAAQFVLLCVAHISPSACDVAGGAGSVNALPAGGGARLAPSFDAATPRNVTALVGKSAYLSCRVRNLGNRTVSWIRHRDLHILTVGGYTYTSDQRFQATHSPQTDDWTLQIKWAQQRDAGVYECQVSTQPVRSFFVTLHVVDCDEIYQRMFSDGGDIVRLVARRRVRGDGEGRGHHVLPAGAGRHARRLGPLLVRALQRRARRRARARAQRRAAGGDADGLGGAVGQLALRAGAAGGGRGARAPARRAARQLMRAGARLGRRPPRLLRHFIRRKLSFRLIKYQLIHS